MKTNLLKVLFVALFLLSATITKAYDFSIGGICYNITSHNTVGVAPCEQKYKGRIVIPPQVTINGDTYKVTSIEFTAFNDCNNLTSITIPISVICIEAGAFNGCISLKSVNIPNSVKSIGFEAFYGCSSLANITIGNSVGTIDDRTFGCCTSLKSVTIPNSVRSIELGAFYNCSSLASVTIGNSVETIGQGAFRDCKMLRSVTIPNSVSEIKKEAFFGCRNLISITIGNNVTHIRQDAFYDCRSLTAVHITDLSAWCGINFYEGDYTYTSNPLAFAENLYLNGEKVTNLIIPNDVRRIKNDAFKNCRNITSVTIPDCVTFVGKNAFKGTAWYDNHPNGLIYIGKVLYAYRGNMPKNQSITIKEGTLTIASSVFKDCSNLKSVAIPESVRIIEDYAFYGCSSLNSVTIPNSVTWIGRYAFNGCDGLESIIIPNNVTSIGEGAFNECESLHFFCNLSSASCYPEYGYPFLRCFTAPGGTIEGDFVFGKIDGVNTLLGYIGNKNNITLPTDYKGENYIIMEKAFKNCKSLRSVTIPNSVTRINNEAFRGCTSLKELRIEDGNNPLSLGANYANYQDYVESGNTSGGLFYDCPLETLYLGRNLNYHIGEYYGNSPFYGLGKLRSVIIGDKVTSIGENAFQFCGLTCITIPNSVTSIGDEAFESCYSLQEITIGNNISYIGYDVFSRTAWEKSATENLLYLNNWLLGEHLDKRVKSIKIKEGTRGVAAGAFKGNFWLKKVRMNEELEYICAEAFGNCSSLQPKKIIWPKLKSRIKVHRTAFSKRRGDSSEHQYTNESTIINDLTTDEIIQQLDIDEIDM